METVQKDWSVVIWNDLLECNDHKPLDLRGLNLGRKGQIMICCHMRKQEIF